jgi:hypothetical protein
MLVLYVWFVAPTIASPFRNHRFPEGMLDVSVTLPAPQNVVGPLVVIVGVGSRLIVTEAEVALLHPPTVTE